MTLREFLSGERWAVYEIVPSERRFFGDTAFGPMWKPIPPDVVIPSGMDNLKSWRKVEAFIRGNDS